MEPKNNPKTPEQRKAESRAEMRAMAELLAMDLDDAAGWL